jgi:multidrug efflux pump subunit AcrB
MDIVRPSPGIAVLRDDCGPDSPQVKIEIDPDRANLVGITNSDVAASFATAISGSPVGTFKEGNKSIPIVARLRPQDRAQLSQIESLYVYSSQQNTRVPLLSVASVRNILETGRIRRPRTFSHDFDIVLSGARSPRFGSAWTDRIQTERSSE